MSETATEMIRQVRSLERQDTALDDAEQRVYNAVSFHEKQACFRFIRLLFAPRALCLKSERERHVCLATASRSVKDGTCDEMDACLPGADRCPLDSGFEADARLLLRRPKRDIRCLR